MFGVNRSTVSAVLKATMQGWTGPTILISLFLASLAYVAYGSTPETSSAIEPKTSISAVAVVPADEHRDAAIPRVVVTASRAQVQAAQAKHLKELERENARLKRVVADLSLEKAAMKDVANENI